MPRRLPALLGLLVAAATVAAFVSGGHTAATSLIRFQQSKHLEELAALALRRSEAAVDFAVETLNEVDASGAAACNASALQSVRLHVYRRGAVKDVRVVEQDGSVRCSAYSETLEFDQGWVTFDQMLPARAGGIRLFRVDQFFGTALGVMRPSSADTSGLVAILGLGAASLDVMPSELQARSSVALQLADSGEIARAGAAGPQTGTTLRASERYPIRVVLAVEPGALQNWDTQPYWPIMTLALALGTAFAVLLARIATRSPDPIRDIDRGIAQREFKPFLQPVFEIGTGRVTGAEILARRIRPDGSVEPPSRFIELAEASGRIPAITWQILAQALEETKLLLKRDPGFRLAVNVAPRHFTAPRFVADLAAVVHAAGVATSQVTLELTERESFDDLNEAAGVVAAVRALGFRVALDDVGTGHSGLSQIQSLGAQVLKVDKFFVDGILRDPAASVVVQMLVRMAAELDMGIVAEGIETPEQAAALARCGVTHGQGYWIAPPLPVAAFLTLLHEQAMREALADAPQPVAFAA